jgi:epoxyqueuosine reductase
VDPASPDEPAWQADLALRLREAGAALVGFADLTPLPQATRHGLPRALSLAVALDPAIVAGLTAGPTTAYHVEYQRANELLARLADQAVATLQAHGFVARTSAVTVKVVVGDGGTPLPHKTVATHAGLGWIGHSAVLVTPRFGKAVRLASVLTDAPLACAAPVDRSRCGTCRACVDACPAGAIKGVPWSAGIARDRIVDVLACEPKASALARAQGIDVTICGICILACPWTRRYLRRSGIDVDAGELPSERG